MVKYRLIIEYHKKGNNNTQVATLCGCSRMTVWKVVERLNVVKIETEEVLNLSDDEIKYILFPERSRRGEGFLAIDFKWEEFQMCKHKSSLRLCWRRYCKRAVKQGLKAYSWKSYLYFYIGYKKPRADEDNPHDAVRNKLKRYNLLLSYCNPGGTSYEKIKQEKEDWLKSLHLEENNAAISRLPQDFYVNPEPTEEAESKEEVEVDYDVKPMNLKAVNGKLYMRVGDSMVEQPVPSFPKDAYQRIVEMIAIRKQLRKVLDLQVEGCSDDVLTREQWQLGARYDMFVKRFGYINSKNNLRLFKPDGDSALLFACENVSDDEETVTKADVFTKRTIRPYTAVTSTDDCFEALQISKNERGCVDISYIEELTKKDYETVLAELGNAVFRNPVAVNPEDKYSGFETAEEYLSGRVVDKLQAAERMRQSNPDLIDFDKNISALREVQPSPVKASDIAVRVGTSWIDKELYKEFFCELIGMPYYYRDGVELYYNKHDGSWRIDRTRYARGYDSINVDKVYGTSRANAYRLFEDCVLVQRG